MTRVICGFCGNAGKEECKECEWIYTKYPSKYVGRKFRSMKGLNKVVG